MKLSLLIIGSLFLLTPELSFLDVLPDFIGLLLIAKALSPLSEISPSAESATQKFRKAALVSVVQFAFLLPMISVTVSDGAMQLLFVAVFHLLRLIFVLPAFHDLFASLRYLFDKHGSTSRLLPAVSVFVPIALLTHSALTLLPQLVYLKVEEFGVRYPLTADAGRNGMTTYQTLLRFSLIASAILLGIWLISMTAYYVSIARNKDFRSYLLRAIAASPRSLSKTVLSTVRPSLSLLTTAAFCSVVLTLDGLPLIPPALAPFLQFIALGRLSKILTKGKGGRVFPLLGGIAGLLLHLGLYMFCEVNHETALIDFATAERYFRLPMTLDVIYSVLSIFTALCLYRKLRALIHEHSGAFWEGAYLTHNSLVGKEKARQLFSLLVVTVLSILHSLTSTISYYYLYSHPTYRLINSLFGLIVAIASCALYHRILLSVQEKYSDNSAKTEV